MKYFVEDVFDAPLKDVIEICLDRSRDTKVYPNVTKSEVKKRETRGSKMYVTVETLANGDIPPKLRKLVHPHMLTWTEEGIFDYDKNTYDYKVRTHFFSNLTSIKGHFDYSERDGKTVRKLEGEIKVNLPLLGQIVEAKVVEVQKANLRLDVKNILEELKTRKK